MKKTLLFISILLSGCVFAQDVGICELPLTTTVSPNDLLIIERADCSDPNGTQAIKISDLTGTGTQSSTPLYFVLAATTGSLNMTYSSGTLTAVSNGRLANQDGIKLTLNDSVLFKDQASQLQNGIYIVLDTGTISTKAKLYRNPNYNTTAAIYPSQVNVLQGTTQAGNYYYESTINPIVGTSSITYITGVKPYVPYTNAIANVNLNAKDLTNVGTFQTNKDASVNGVKIGSGFNNICNNVLLGSGLTASGGCRNTAIGKPSQTSMLLGSDNTSVGYNSLNSATSANNNTAVGSGVLSSVIGGVGNTGVGLGSLASITNTTYNTAIGISSGASNTGGYNTFIGHFSGQNGTSVNNNTFVGGQAGYNNSGSNNTSIGTAAGYSSAGNGNVFLGFSAGYFETGSNKLYISNSNTSNPLLLGDFSANTLTINGATTTTLSNSYANTPTAHDSSTKIATTLYVDRAVASSGSSGWSLTGNSGTTPGTHFLGTSDNKNLMFKTNNVQSGVITTTGGLLSLGYQSLLSNTSGTNNTAVGTRALVNNTTGRENTCVGNQAGEDITTGFRNTIGGHQAAQNGGKFLGNNNTGFGLVVLGGNSITSTTITAIGSVAVGDYVLGNITSGNYNTGVGSSCLVNNTTGGGNTAVGQGTLYSNISGKFNTAIGYQSLLSSTGNFNIGVGDSAGYGETGNEKFHLGVHNSPYLDGSMTAGAKTLTISAVTTTTLSNSYANTPTALDNSTKIATTAYVDAGRCREYIANMTQTGTLAPVASVTFNTLGFTPTWSRNSIGNYSLTHTGGFASNVSVTTSIDIAGSSAFAVGVNATGGAPDFIVVNAYSDTTPTLTDGVKFTIDVKVCQ